MEKKEEYRDVVCNMECDPEKAQKVEYQGKTYYFCSDSCKKAFDAQPDFYLSGHEKHVGKGTTDYPA